MFQNMVQSPFVMPATVEVLLISVETHVMVLTSSGPKATLVLTGLPVVRVMPSQGTSAERP